MMKKMIQWVLAATLICGASVLNSCKDAHAQEDNPAPQVVSTELIRTSRVRMPMRRRTIPRRRW